MYPEYGFQLQGSQNILFQKAHIIAIFLPSEETLHLFLIIARQMIDGT